MVPFLQDSEFVAAGFLLLHFVMLVYFRLRSAS